MRIPRMYQKPAIGIGIAAIVAVLSFAALASDSTRIEKSAAVDAEQYADFIENEVFDIQDLAEGAEIQRRMFNRMTPPGFSWVQPMLPPVVPFDAENFDEKFLDELLGEDKNSVAIYPLSLMQDPKTRETLVYNADGKLIATIPADRISRVWPMDSDPARVTLQLDLLPSEDVEPYLYTESRIEDYVESLATKTTKSSEIALRSLGASEFGIAGVQRLTNGNTRITVTNGTDAAEVFAYTVWHTSSVFVVVWTNEFDEVLTNSHTAWHPVSPAFAGIESAWVSLTSSLALSNGVGVFMDTGISEDSRVRFYAAAQLVDSDGDGISDGEEIFLYRTDPNDPADFPAIPELDAAMSEVNALQLGYLSYLVEQASARSSGLLNYAQQIQQMRSALEGVLSSFLDLDVNQGGTLAEGSQVVTWTLPTVLASVGNSSGTWLGGMVTPAHFQEIAAVLAKLTHLVHEVSYHSGYPHQAIASNASPVLVNDWELGTGYPQSWPQSQPIRTYLLFHNKVSIPSVGDGTIDDWIEVNNERFPDSGSIYFNHVAEITAPIWNASGANTLELWDCGDCAGENNHAYLSPFTVLHVLEVPGIKVEISLSDTQACDGEEVEVDLIVTPGDAVSSISSVQFTASQPFGGTQFDNPSGQGIMFTQRSSVITEWLIPNVRWYATVASQCNGWSDYEIKASYFVGSQQFHTDPVMFIAFASGCIYGSADPFQYFSGNIDITSSQISATNWEATVSQGTFQREVLALYMVDAPTNSQFYNMVLNEELFHRDMQFENPNHPLLSAYWLPSNVMANVTAQQPYAGATEQAAIEAARDSFIFYREAEIVRGRYEALTLPAYPGAVPGAIRCALEAEAKAAAGSSHCMKIECSYQNCP